MDETKRMYKICLNLIVVVIILLSMAGGCEYEFTNLNATIEIDWSTINGKIIYTISVSSSTLLTSSTDASTVTLKQPPNITMITTLSQFKFDEHTRQLVVRDCLEYMTTYELQFTIDHDNGCETLGLLTIITTYATPVYNGILKSYIFEPVDDPAMLFLDLFQIKIINDKYFGGCGSFQCSAYCLNDEQWFFVQMFNFYVMTRRSTLLEDFTYQLLITCLDVEDDAFITEDHNNTVNITFIRTTTTTGYTSASSIGINGTSNSSIVQSSVTESSSSVSSTEANKATTYMTVIGSNQTDQMMDVSNEGAPTGGDGFFDNALNLASVTSSIGIAAVCGVAVACYRIYKKVKQRPRLTPVREL